MPTYDYRCEGCGAEVEHRQSISLPPPSALPCACGAKAERVYDFSRVQVCVLGNQRDFKLDATCVPIGWDKGNTAEKQEARYRKLIADNKKKALAVDKKAIKGGIRHIATVPREFHRMRSNQYGKKYFDPASQSTAEIKQKLKSDGLLFKD